LIKINQDDHWCFKNAGAWRKGTTPKQDAKNNNTKLPGRVGAMPTMKGLHAIAARIISECARDEEGTK
jgi:hypothetical protein